jgi:hypothetical protein
MNVVRNFFFTLTITAVLTVQNFEVISGNINALRVLVCTGGSYAYEETSDYFLGVG